MIYCDKCDGLISLDPDDDKLKSHMQWHHPTEAMEAQLLVAIYKHAVGLTKAWQAEDYIQANMIANDLSSLALRSKKYADLRLED